MTTLGSTTEGCVPEIFKYYLLVECILTTWGDEINLSVIYCNIEYSFSKCIVGGTPQESLCKSLLDVLCDRVFLT